MSQEQAQAFIERLKTDEAFRQKVLAVEGTEERLALARAEGYECSVEEIAAAGSRLADKELELISAGMQTNNNVDFGW
jgi:predicted ribosomally synthesized peptide with nif11-like leader